ncbi:MAG: DUF4442 domain-containing protein [Chitinophagales bacterium]
MALKPKISPRVFKRMLNWYLPFIFNRIKVKRISADYHEMDVLLKKSFFNKNLAGTIFGGSIFSAADPFFPLMFWQIFAHRYNEHIQVWTKSAEIKFIKPADTNLKLEFRVTEEEVLEAKRMLAENGKYSITHQIELLNTRGEVAALATVVSYLGTKPK